MSIKELKEKLYELCPDGDLWLKDGQIVFYTAVETTEAIFHGEEEN